MAEPPLIDRLDPELRERLQSRRAALCALPWPERVTEAAAWLGTPDEVRAAAMARAERGHESLLLGEDGHESDELDPRAERVSVLTLHGAKGLEFPVVFVAGCEAALLPGNGATPDEIEEERRLFYVGMTRAKDRLYLSHARCKVDQGAPSPFLGEIPPACLAEPVKPPPRKRPPQMKLF